MLPFFQNFARLGKLACRFAFKVGKPDHQETFDNYTWFSYVPTSANWHQHDDDGFDYEVLKMRVKMKPGVSKCPELL